MLRSVLPRTVRLGHLPVKAQRRGVLDLRARSGVRRLPGGLVARAREVVLGESGSRFAGFVGIPGVPGALGQQEQVLVIHGGPVLDRGGHGVGLAPDDVRAQPPAVRLERQGQTPGHAAQVLGLEAERNLGAVAPGCAVFLGVLTGQDGIAPVVRARGNLGRVVGVAVAHVDPARAIRA